jgi:hypothetical protein
LPQTISDADFHRLLDETGNAPSGKRNRAILWTRLRW